MPEPKLARVVKKARKTFLGRGFEGSPPQPGPGPRALPDSRPEKTGRDVGAGGKISSVSASTERAFNSLFCEKKISTGADFFSLSRRLLGLLSVVAGILNTLYRFKPF